MTISHDHAYLYIYNNIDFLEILHHAHMFQNFLQRLGVCELGHIVLVLALLYMWNLNWLILAKLVQSALDFQYDLFMNLKLCKIVP